MFKLSSYAISCLLATSLIATPVYANPRPAAPSYDIMADNDKMEKKEEERFKRAEEREKMRHEKKEEKIKERHEKREEKMKERQEKRHGGKDRDKNKDRDHISGTETHQPSGNPPHISGDASSGHVSGK